MKTVKQKCGMAESRRSCDQPGCSILFSLGFNDGRMRKTNNKLLLDMNAYELTMRQLDDKSNFLIIRML